MSLAIAEVLYKHTGDSSIEKMRGPHSHHGLETAWKHNFNSSDEIFVSASALLAKRAKRSNGEGFGTFELWHQTAREHPLGGKRTTINESGRQMGFSALFTGSDRRFPLVPPNGISLLECYQSLPGMSNFLGSRGLNPQLARATMIQELNTVEKYVETQLTFHPDPANVLSSVYEKIQIQPIGCMRVTIHHHGQGITLKWRYSHGDLQFGVSVPPSIQLEDSLIHFFSKVDFLNEFGLMYCGLFILGMYARYYPERWMADVEMTSELALSALEFLDICESRLPVCALAEFSKTAYVRASAYI